MQENNNSSGRRGFALTMENLFELMQQVYYTKGQTESRFVSKDGGVINGSITIQGSITVAGSTYAIDTETINVKDYTITLAKDNEQTLTSMVGMVVPKYDGTNYGFFGWDADGFAYVGDLTNYDGSSAITLANNSSLQKIATIDNNNTIAPGVGKVYLYDSTNNVFKEAGNDNKNYVIKNGELVEDSDIKTLKQLVGEGFTTNKNITFGSSGNYTTELDLSGLTINVNYQDNATNNTQFKENSELTFDIDEDGYFVLEGYSGYSSFEVEINGQTISNLTGTYTSPRTTYAQTIIVRALSSSNYYISLNIYKYISKSLTEAVNDLLSKPQNSPSQDDIDNWNSIMLIKEEFSVKTATSCAKKISCNKIKIGNSILPYSVATKWETKTWTDLTDFYGNNIWTDGDNIYYSRSPFSLVTNVQYILNKTTNTWSVKNWGVQKLNGIDIWTDGDNIYCSNNSYQYVLDKSTSTWSTKTWTGLTDFYGSNIWTDGDNIYYSNGTTQYVLDKATSTWSTKTWTGLTGFLGNNIWTDGDNIYYSNGGSQYVLDKSTSTWSTKTWTGNYKPSYGNRVWTDGVDIYYSDGGAKYVLDKTTSTWNAKAWNYSIDSIGVWTNGENIYYSNNGTNLILERKSFNLGIKLNTSNTTGQSTDNSENINYGDTINLHKVAKTGSFYDLLNRPSFSNYPKRLQGDFEICCWYEGSSSSDLVIYIGDSQEGERDNFDEKISLGVYTKDTELSHGTIDVYRDEDEYAFAYPEFDLSNLYGNNTIFEFRYCFYKDGNVIGICRLQCIPDESDYRRYWQSQSELYMTVESKYTLLHNISYAVEVMFDGWGYCSGDDSDENWCSIPAPRNARLYKPDGTMELISLLDICDKVCLTEIVAIDDTYISRGGE